MSGAAGTSPGGSDAPAIRYSHSDVRDIRLWAAAVVASTSIAINKTNAAEFGVMKGRKSFT